MIWARSLDLSTSHSDSQLFGNKGEFGLTQEGGKYASCDGFMMPDLEPHSTDGWMDGNDRRGRWDGQKSHPTVSQQQNPSDGRSFDAPTAKGANVASSLYKKAVIKAAEWGGCSPFSLLRLVMPC